MPIPAPKSFQNLLALSWPRTWKVKCISQFLRHLPHISLAPQTHPLPPLLLTPLSLPSSQNIPPHLRIVAAVASTPKMSALIAVRADTLAGSARPPMSTVPVVGIASCEQRAIASTLMPMAGRLGSCAKRSRHRQGQEEIPDMLLGLMSRSLPSMLALSFSTWTGQVRLVELPT